MKTNIGKNRRNAVYDRLSEIPMSKLSDDVRELLIEISMLRLEIEELKLGINIEIS